MHCTTPPYPSSLPSGFLVDFWGREVQPLAVTMNLLIFLSGTTSFAVSIHTVHLKWSQHCLLIGYTPIQKRKLKKKKKKKRVTSKWLRLSLPWPRSPFWSCHLLSQLSSPTSPVFSFSLPPNCWCCLSSNLYEVAFTWGFWQSSLDPGLLLGSPYSFRSDFS